MVKRRKVLLGLGSLAAGSAAAMGTGALSAAEADRTLTGEITGDNSAYLEMRAGGNQGRNNFAVEQTPEGIQLDFDQAPGGGEGLNPNAVSYFDQVFIIRAAGGSPEGELLDVYIEDDMENVTFYYGPTGAPGLDGNGRVPIEGSDNAVGIGRGNVNNRINVGIRVDLSGVSTADGELEDVVDGEFTVVADTLGD